MAELSAAPRPDNLERLRDLAISKNGGRDANAAFQAVQDRYIKSLNGTAQGALYPGSRITPDLFFNENNCFQEATNVTINHGVQASDSEPAKIGAATDIEFQCTQNLQFVLLFVTIPDLGPYITAGLRLHIHAGWGYNLIASYVGTYPKAGSKAFTIDGGASLVNYFIAMFAQNPENLDILYQGAGQALTFIGGQSGVYSVAQRTAILYLPVAPVYGSPEARKPLPIANMKQNNIRIKFNINDYSAFCMGDALENRGSITMFDLENFALHYVTIDMDTGSGIGLTPAQDALNKITALTTWVSSVELNTIDGSLVLSYPCQTTNDLIQPLVPANGADGGIPTTFTTTFQFTDVGNASNWFVYLQDARDNPEYKNKAQYRGNCWATVPTENVEVTMSKTPLHQSSNTTFENYEQRVRSLFCILADTQPDEWGRVPPLGGDYSNCRIRRQVTNIQWSMVETTGTANRHGTRNEDTRSITVKFTVSPAVAAGLTAGVIPRLTAITEVTVFTDAISAIGIEQAGGLA
jgi:hypothetical protein